MVLLRKISPTPGNQVFILVFEVPSPKCFAQPGDRHSCQSSNTGSALERKKENFQKTRGRNRSSQKNAWRRSGVFKKASKTSSKPKAQELERLAPNLSKARETKKLFETDTTLERKEIISSFERKTSLESLAQTFLRGRVPPTPTTCHSPMTDIRHTATEMIILMTDISVMWHSKG